jgi:signal transduction histidine kinase
MRLSTRFMIAMIGLVVVTVTVITVLNYRVFELASGNQAYDRFQRLIGGIAQSLETSTADARPDVLALRASAAATGIVRASLAGGIDPASGTTLDGWRAQMATRCAAELTAKPFYRQCRFITVADGGRDIVRVERDGVGSTVRVVPDADPPRCDCADLLRRTSGLADGDIYVSAVEPMPQAVPPETARIPTLWVATPAPSLDGRPSGLIALAVDLRPAFAQARAAARPLRPFLLAAVPSRSIFVVNEQGDFLVHPDPARELTSASPTPFRLQDEFPNLAGMLQAHELDPRLTRDRTGAIFAVGLTAARLAGTTRVVAIMAVPIAEALAANKAVLNTSLIGGLAALLCAIVLAIMVARSMSKPIVQMTDAVTAFARGEPMTVPAGQTGEIGVLAAAFTGMARDVTEKAAAIHRNAEILDLIVSRMADAVLLIDEAAAILFANAAARSMLGERAATGWNAWSDAYQTFQADAVTPLAVEDWPLSRALRGENVDNFELVFRARGDERTVHIIVSARPIAAAADAPSGAVLVFRDVTSWKETERQLREAQKMEAIGQLTGGIAHDFNNMLTVITGTIDILISGVADRPSLKTIARMIDQAASRGADLTRQLLAFARKQPLQPRDTDIEVLVTETAKLLRPTLGEHVEIESVFETGTWRAMIDPTQLSSALVNLALNARDAMPAGGKLTFETANVILDEAYALANPDVVPGPYVMVAVSDTGPGIPAALHDKIFEPFFTTKEIGRGTGLGLSMVYGFVKQSNGHIKVYSETGHGTTMKLYLPRSREEAEKPEAIPAPLLQGGHESILVVEDDALVRNYVMSQIQSLGYRAIAAVNGTEALALLDRGASFDLLFTDVVMPGGMNGRELAAKVRRRRPGTRVLYTSGYTENAIMHHGRLDPGVALLNKPYRLADLARKIREVLGEAEGGMSG